MKNKFWMLLLMIVALLAVGCARRSGNTVEPQRNDPVTRSEDARAREAAAQRRKEFDRAREELIRAGTINRDTPTYGLREIVPLVGLDRKYYLDIVVFGERDRGFLIGFNISFSPSGREVLSGARVKIVVGGEDFRIGAAGSFGSQRPDGYLRSNFRTVRRQFEIEHLEYIVVFFSAGENNDAFIVLRRDIIVW